MLTWFDFFFPRSVFRVEDVVGWSDMPVERALCAYSTGNRLGVERKTRGRG